MKVLVTGGAGFIGAHLAAALVARGDVVRTLDSLEARVHAGTVTGPSAAVEALRGDVADPKALLNALTGMDAVVHLAAYQDYLPDFSRFFGVNTVSTALLYELIVREQLPITRVVVASSQAVYGEGRYRCEAHGEFSPAMRAPDALARGDWEVQCPECQGAAAPVPLQESWARPQNPYGLSKRDQEDIAMILGVQYAIPSVALRYSIVQGAGQSFRNAYSGALRSFTVRVLHDQPPVLFEDGGQLRDFVSIHDVIGATLMATDRPDMVGEVFNIGGDRAVSVRQLADLVLDAAGRSIEPVVPALFRRGDARHSISDVSKLRRLGWSPAVTQRDIVREYVAWASSHPDLRDTYAAAEARMKALGVLRTARVAGS